MMGRRQWVSRMKGCENGMGMKMKWMKLDEMDAAGVNLNLNN